MSFGSSESDHRELFSDATDQPTSSLFYKERRHIRAYFRKLIAPVVVLIVPMMLVVSFANIGSIIGTYIDTDGSFVAQRLAIARGTFEQWISQFGDISWLSVTIVTVWILTICWLTIKSHYDWMHAYNEISLDYVIATQKLLLQNETSLTIETKNITGASVKRTLSDKFFPHCGSVVVQTIDFNGEGDQIFMVDVKDPYRMRSVILNVKRHITAQKGR